MPIPTPGIGVEDWPSPESWRQILGPAVAEEMIAEAYREIAAGLEPVKLGRWGTRAWKQFEDA